MSTRDRQRMLRCSCVWVPMGLEIHSEEAVRQKAPIGTHVVFAHARCDVVKLYNNTLTFEHITCFQLHDASKLFTNVFCCAAIFSPLLHSMWKLRLASCIIKDIHMFSPADTGMGESYSYTFVKKNFVY